MGQLYWVYAAAIASIAIAAAFGFILLIDASINSPFPEIADQGLAGALLFLAVLYIGLALKVAIKRFLARRLYIENGYYLAPRVMVFDDKGLQNNSTNNQMQVAWKDVIGIYESKQHLFFQIEPAFTLFVPKRIATSPDELIRLKDFANKMRAESAATS